MSELKFNKFYFLLTLLLLATEILIASFVNDKFIRPHLGDVLVVILIYCFIRSLFIVRVLTAALIVLAFSFTIETLQYFKIVELMQLQESKFARAIIGTTFQWLDLIAYLVGILLIIYVEKIVASKKNL